MYRLPGRRLPDRNMKPTHIEAYRNSKETELDEGSLVNVMHTRIEQYL